MIIILYMLKVNCIAMKCVQTYVSVIILFYRGVIRGDMIINPEGLFRKENMVWVPDEDRVIAVVLHELAPFILMVKTRYKKSEISFSNIQILYAPCKYQQGSGIIHPGLQGDDYVLCN